MTVTINGTSGITLPSGSSAVGTTDSQTLTNKTIGSGYSGSTVTSGTAVASTSGTSIDFTSIPSWAKRITLMLNGVSTSGSTNILFQLGSAASGIETTGYLSYFGYVNTTVNIGSATSSAGLGIWHGGATDAHYLPVCFHLVSGNTWIQSHAGGFYNGSAVHQQTGGGTKTLAGTLDRIRITTANGTDTFDAGSINILYE